MRTTAALVIVAGLTLRASVGAAQTYTEITPGPGAISASTDDGNVPANTVDNDLGTRWSAQGDGHWIRYDLGGTQVVAYLKIASYSGNTRRAKFDIQVSDDASTWATVWVGQSSGTTTAQETYDVADVAARYVRFLGHGNTANNWNSFTEVDVFASSGTPEPPTPTPTPTAPPTASPTPTPTATPGPPTPPPTPMPNTSACMSLFNTDAPWTEWARYDPAGSGMLTYQPLDDRGDHIMDFSHAGYKDGGVALPIVAPTIALSPAASGDDTPRIQAALDQVAALPVDPDTGFRGAVMLEAGAYRIDGTLNLNASGVVLRGAGSDPAGSVLQLTTSPHKALALVGSGSRILGTPVSIVDFYLPSGARSLDIANSSGLNVGDRVLVRRRATTEWVHFMQMDDLVRNGAPQNWISAGSTFITDRRIVAISGNHITFDAPVTDSFDATYLGLPAGDVVPFTFPGRISNVGAEDLRVIAPAAPAPINQPNYKAFSVDNVEDGWVKNVYARDCQSGVSVGDGSRRITFDRVTLDHTVAANTSAGAPGDFGISGSQTLLMRCRSLNAANVFYALTQSMDTGPIVLLDFQASGGTAIQPHQRWATGLLVDRAYLSSGSIELENRGNLGSGQGWTMGWGVVWNSAASHFTVQQPPGATNWAIGNLGPITDRPRYGTTGPNLPRGTFDSHGTPVQPTSLYLAQLCDRLGPQALTSIGYADVAAPPTPTPTPTSTPGTPTPTPTPTATPVGFTFEAEALPYTTSGATNVPGNDPLASAGVWMAFGATGVGQWVEYTLPSLPHGTYDLKFKYKTNPNRGIHNVAVDGVVVGGTIDQYKTGAGTFPEVTMGTVRFATDGPHTIRLTAVDKRAAAGAYTVSSDRFVLIADTKPPVVTVADVETEATGPAGAIVTFDATAVDDKDGAVSVTVTPPSGSTFPLGVSTVTATATDFAGNLGTGIFVVNVVDTTPPELSVPEDITAEATSPQGAVVEFTVTAHDLVRGDVPVTTDFPSGSTFGLGRWIVSAHASDGPDNNIASSAFVIDVVDTTPPALSLPGHLVIEATGPEGAAVAFASSAQDLVSGSVPVTLSATSGSTFPLGPTTVSASATDAAGNTAQGEFIVEVVDTTPPVLTLPEPLVLEAAGPAGAVAIYTASAHDIVSGDVPAILEPPSGRTFPLGVSTVAASAVDGAGNVAHGEVIVKVVDTTPPVLALPTPIVIEATSPEGAVATFTAAAQDIVSGALPVVFAPPSGSTFPLGTTTVIASAVDAAGNVGTGTFTVKVVDTIAPVITVPPDVTTALCRMPDIGQATATDAAGTPTLTNDAPFLFGLGTTVVTWRAVDASGNVATGTQRVTAELGDDASCCPVGTKVILGTNGNDVLLGTSGRDCILGRGGNDVIAALGGDDFISGGEGNDVIAAGPGNDVIFGGPGDDIIDGGPGNDQIHGGPGRDTIAAGTGSDIVDGGPDVDVCAVPPDGHDEVKGCPF
jgi:Ca2+-binding RTX toxin-like protein